MVDTVEITLRVPKDRSMCAEWLMDRPPASVADFLEAMRGVCDTENEFLLWSQERRHTQETSLLRKEMDSLSSQHDMCLRLLETERDVYKSQIERLLSSERFSPPPSAPREGPSSSLEEELHTLVTEYYSSRNKLPRDASEVTKLLSPEKKREFLSTPSLYDSVVANIKRQHYSKRRKKEEPEVSS